MTSTDIASNSIAEERTAANTVADGASNKATNSTTNSATNTLASDIPLPAYPGIKPQHIYLVRTADDVAHASKALLSADVLGFDTESKPIFNKGQRSDGPHLIQLATDDAAFLFPCVDSSDTAHALALLRNVLESQQILKVGFGLRDDNQRLKAKLRIELANVLDLSRTMRESKYREMGAKAAVAKFFAQTLQKSKKTSTSNWAISILTDRQLKYAADDAQVALLTYRKWLLLRNN